MKLPRISAGRKGFTVVEMLIVIGILAVIFSIGGPIAWNFYLDYQFDSEFNLLTALLRNARNLSMVNHNESSHGLYIDSSSFVVFQGQNYASRVVSLDKSFPRNAAISITGPNELVFAALSGQTSSSTYNFTGGRQTKEIFVNPEGLIYE